jgi:hypothetical protein
VLDCTTYHEKEVKRRKKGRRAQNVYDLKVYQQLIVKFFLALFRKMVKPRADKLYIGKSGLLDYYYSRCADLERLIAQRNYFVLKYFTNELLGKGTNSDKPITRYSFLRSQVL